MPQHDLIFDIGFHKGEDAAFYLAKGFRVVGVEANPALIAPALERLGEQNEGRLTIVNKALARENGREETFYVSTFSDWSSLRPKLASRAGQPTEIRVQTVTLASLVAEHGTPYYLKCDIEGHDLVCAEQLCLLAERPPFVSFEASHIDIFAALHAAGYRHCQLVNQAIHPARYWRGYLDKEGVSLRYQFEGDCSGPFARDLPENKWIDLGSAIERFERFSALASLDDELGVGWLDVHARL